MYSIKIYDAVIGDAQQQITSEQESKVIARATFEKIWHDNNLAMCCDNKQKIVLNERIGSKLHQVSLYVNQFQFNNATLICIISITAHLFKLHNWHNSTPV